MLNWQKMFGGGLTKPDENGVQHRQSYKQMLRPIEEMYRNLLQTADAVLRHKTSVYMTLVSATVAGFFLVFTPFGWALQGAVLSTLHLGNRNDVIQLRFPSIVSLLGTSSSGFKERVNQGTNAAAEVAVLYGAGLAGEYSDDLARISGKFPVIQVAQVATAMNKAFREAKAGSEPASACPTKDEGCLKIELVLSQMVATADEHNKNMSNPISEHSGRFSTDEIATVAVNMSAFYAAAVQTANAQKLQFVEPGTSCNKSNLCTLIESKLAELVAGRDAVQQQMAKLTKAGTNVVSEATCSSIKSGGFYSPTKRLHYSPLVYAGSPSRADAVATLNVIRAKWQSGKLDVEKEAGLTEVKSLRELFSHRLSDSCSPIKLGIFNLNGKTTQYLVSALFADGESVGSALFMLYDLEDAGVKDRGMVRLQTANLKTQGNLANTAGRAEEIGATQAAQTYSEIAKQMGREGLSVDIESPNSKDVGFLSALIQPKSK